jgi:hypothetical protein
VNRQEQILALAIRDAVRSGSRMNSSVRRVGITLDALGCSSFSIRSAIEDQFGHVFPCRAAFRRRPRSMTIRDTPKPQTRYREGRSVPRRRRRASMVRRP